MNIKQNGSDIIMNYVDILSIDVGFKRKEGDRGGGTFLTRVDFFKFSLSDYLNSLIKLFKILIKHVILLPDDVFYEHIDVYME